MRFDLYSPADVFDELFGFMDPVFPGRHPRPEHRPFNTMKTDITEKDGHYNMAIELPGYNKEDISIDLFNGTLTVKAEHKNESEEKDEKGNVVRSERYFGTCSRSFYVGNSVKAADITAKYENGVLNLILPTEEKKALETKETVSIG